MRNFILIKALCIVFGASASSAYNLKVTRMQYASSPLCRRLAIISAENEIHPDRGLFAGQFESAFGKSALQK